MERSETRNVGVYSASSFDPDIDKNMVGYHYCRFIARLYDHVLAQLLEGDKAVSVIAEMW